MKNISVGRWLVIVTLALLAVVSFISGAGLIVSSHGAATTSDVVRQGKHRDCVMTIATARNAVFQNVDIYRAVQSDQLSTALLNSQQGIKATPEQVQAFADNQELLDGALVEARRVQPADFLDKVIDHGGVIDGVHYDACPA